MNLIRYIIDILLLRRDCLKTTMQIKMVKQKPIWAVAAVIRSQMALFKDAEASTLNHTVHKKSGGIGEQKQIANVPQMF